MTICTHNRQSFFGKIIDGEMQLSQIGEIVAEEWQKTSQIRPCVQLDAWVIMPNHIHGILIINNPLVETFRRNVSTHRNVSTNNVPRLQSNSLGLIIGQFKSVCSKQIWIAGFTEFKWQTRFHDSIIRDEESLNRVRKYIINNPAKWESDKHHPENFRIQKRNH
ncbi:hypothetical protein PI95_008820 [Hassallia byssoidea VB512170]|uniref:Transposase IS200-like domain-containing protein n=2 Tax=Hassallia TaxID=482629 RepID=A0A846H6R1_9CYAN|nr:hypothetical protein [Hassalia byssoidea VB512170]